MKARPLLRRSGSAKASRRGATKIEWESPILKAITTIQSKMISQNQLSKSNNLLSNKKNRPLLSNNGLLQKPINLLLGNVLYFSDLV
jgi:hypothetical protein